MECLDKAEPKASSTKSSAARLNLFIIDEDCEKPSEEKSETSHKIVEKMLFDTKRARTYPGTATSYLTTRVRDPYQSYWMKMRHFFMYVR